MAKIINVIENKDHWLIHFENNYFTMHKKHALSTTDSELTTEEMVINEFCKMYKETKNGN
jgi:hypothetical protein